MSDPDKSFESDESIRQIAEDLNRINKVAELLRKAQTSVDTVLSASEEVINKAGDFAANSTKILQRLDDVDLDGRLHQLQTALSETRHGLASTERQLASALNELSERQDARFSEIRPQLSALSAKQSESSSELSAGIERLSKELDKTRRSLDALQPSLERGLEAHSARTREVLEDARKQLLLAGAVGMVLAIVIIILLLFT